MKVIPAVAARKTQLHLKSQERLSIKVDGVTFYAARVITLAPHEVASLQCFAKAAASSNAVQRAAAGALSDQEQLAVYEAVNLLFAKIFASIPRRVAGKIGVWDKQEVVNDVFKAVKLS